MEVSGRPEIVLNAFLFMLTRDFWGCIYSPMAEVRQVFGHQACVKAIWMVSLNAVEVILEGSFILKPNEDTALLDLYAG